MQTQTEALAIWRATMQNFFETLPGKPLSPVAIEEDLRRGIELQPISHGTSLLRERFHASLNLMLLGVATMQLIACVNVAGILLTWTQARRGEMAVRVALGSSRARLASQALSESAFLAGIGALFGLSLVWLLTPVLKGLVPPLRDSATKLLPLQIDFGINPRVLFATTVVSTVTMLLIALIPVLQVTRVNLHPVLRADSRSTAVRTRQTFVGLQVGLCAFLLTGAVMMIQTAIRLQTSPLGFDAGHVSTFSFDPRLAGYTPEQIGVFRKEIIVGVLGLPGVTSAATASRGVLRGSGYRTSVAAAGHEISSADEFKTSVNSVSQNYFATLNIPILAGRSFVAADEIRTQPQKAIVNQRFVERFFPNVDPTGRRFGRGRQLAGEDYEIIGVVGDARYRTLNEPVPSTFYTLQDAGEFVLYVRTNGRPESLIQPVRRLIAATYPAIPVLESHTLAEEVAASAAPERFTAATMATFALFSAVLLGLGLYALLSSIVNEQHQAIGVRIALGAEPRDIVIFLARQASPLIISGLILGISCLCVLRFLLAASTFGLSEIDPISILIAFLSVTVICAIAIAIPSYRIRRLDPAYLLRNTAS
jgi:putative ABC transport system permease protein